MNPLGATLLSLSNEILLSPLGETMMSPSGETMLSSSGDISFTRHRLAWVVELMMCTRMSGMQLTCQLEEFKCSSPKEMELQTAGGDGSVA